MYFRKEVISGDGLKRTTWEFMMFENMQFILNEYSTSVKATKRHKNFETLNRYERLSKRDSNLEETEVPIPEFIKNDIRDYVNKLLTVKKWSEYKR